jgi:hypothetical protein
VMRAYFERIAAELALPSAPTLTKPVSSEELSENAAGTEAQA